MESSFYYRGLRTSSVHPSPGDCSSPGCWAPHFWFQRPFIQNILHGKAADAVGRGHNLSTTVVAQSFSQRLSWKMRLKRAAGFNQFNRTRLKFPASWKTSADTTDSSFRECLVLIFLCSLKFPNSLHHRLCSRHIGNTTKPLLLRILFCKALLLCRGLRCASFKALV